MRKNLLMKLFFFQILFLTFYLIAIVNSHGSHDHSHHDHKHDDKKSQKIHQHHHNHEHNKQDSHNHQHQHEHDKDHHHHSHHDHKTHQHSHNHDNHDHHHNHAHHEHHHDHPHEHHQHHQHHDHHEHEHEEKQQQKQETRNLQQQKKQVNNFQEVEQEITKKFNTPLLSQYSVQFLQMFESKYSRIISSILVISMPSIPIFFVFYLVMALAPKSSSNKANKQSALNFIQNTLIEKMMAFACGTLLGDVLLHIIPHLVEESSHSHHDHSHDHDHDHGHNHKHSLEDMKIYLYIISGVLIFFFLDFILNVVFSKEDQGEKNEKQTQQQQKKKEKKGHGHSHSSSADKSSAIVYLLGDFIHNFTDGLAIGSAYSLNTMLGITTTLAVFFHEIPHELGDFAYLMKKGYSLLSIINSQIITSSGALIGGLLGAKYGEIYKTELLSLTAGAFFYLCLSTLIPEIKEESEKKKSIFSFILNLVIMSFGIYIMYFIMQFE